MIKRLFSAGLAAWFFAASALAAVPAIPPAAPTVLKETLGTELRRLAAIGAVNNPLVNPPLIGATAWAASTAYVTGNQVSNGGSVYQETASSGTSAGSGGPSGFGAAISDGSCTWAYIGPQTAPVVSVSTSNPISSPVAVSTMNGSALASQFSLFGAVFANLGGGASGYNVSTGVNQTGNIVVGSGGLTGYSNVGSAALEWQTDSPDFAIMELNFGSESLFVDVGAGWQLVSIALPQPGGGGFNNYIQVNWSNVATPRQMRRYKFAAGQSWSVYALQMGAIDTLNAIPSVDVVNAICYGDSITAGTAATYFTHDYCNVLAQSMKWENIATSGSPGESYEAGNSGTPASGAGLIGRLSSPYLDLTMFGAPQVIVLAEGVNDTYSNASTITAKVTAVLQLLRATYPSALIVTLGPFYALPPPTLAQQQTIEAAIKSGWLAGETKQGTLGCFVPVISPPNGNLSWINANNLTTYIAASPHPNDAGHLFYGAEAAAWIRQLCLPGAP
jgi:hypothetical protein